MQIGVRICQKDYRMTWVRVTSLHCEGIWADNHGIDLMIEAKDKEQAVLHLYRIYDLHPVIHANLRPPAEHESKETKGRKSHKAAGTGKKKAVKEGVVAEEEEIKGEDPAVEMDEDGNGDQGEEQVGSERAPEKMGVEGILEAVDSVSPKKTPKKVRKAKKLKVEGNEDVEAHGQGEEGKKKARKGTTKKTLGKGIKGVVEDE
jgi:UV DNA damage endonuclease